MSKNKVLTLTVAEQFLAGNGSVELWKFTSIEDAAAEALAKHDGYLGFDFLESLDDSPGHIALAQKLGEQQDGLFLSYLTHLSRDAAQALAKHKGILKLGMRSLSEEVAQALATHEEALYLDHMTSLDGAAAQALAKHKGDLLIRGLKTLSDSAAEGMARHKGCLSLCGVRSLTDAAAQSLSQHEGGFDLEGLRTLSDSPGHIALAHTLVKHDSVYLPFLTSLGDAAAKALAQHKGDFVLSDMAKAAVERARKKLDEEKQDEAQQAKL